MNHVFRDLHARPASDLKAALHTLGTKRALCFIGLGAGFAAAAFGLRSRAKAVRKSEELRSAVLDGLAHDIKTPLTSIKTATAALLQQPFENGKHMELLNIIRCETEKMERLIGECIEGSQAGFLELQPDKRCYEVRQMLEAVLAELDPAVADRIRMQIPDGLPPFNVDFRLAKLLFRQLVDNALKYSYDGSPVVISADQGEGRVLLSIRDWCRGISAEEQAQVFKKHFRGTATDGVQRDGTGIGLAIAKRIAEAHGGEIGLASLPGIGCVFQVSLPVQQGISG